MRMLTINIMQSKTIAKGNIATTVPRIQPSIGTAPSLGVPDKLLLLIGFENPTCLYSRYLLCWLRDHLCHHFHRGNLLLRLLRLRSGVSFGVLGVCCDRLRLAVPDSVLIAATLHTQACLSSLVPQLLGNPDTILLRLPSFSLPSFRLLFLFLLS